MHAENATEGHSGSRFPKMLWYFLKQCLSKQIKDGPESCDPPLYEEAGWAGSWSDPGLRSSLNTAAASPQKSCTDSGFRESNRGNRWEQLNVTRWKRNNKLSVARPTNDLSSICCCIKFKMARNTSSASCCVLTTKQCSHCHKLWKEPH